mgnify:CR=1 FL=1
MIQKQWYCHHLRYSFYFSQERNSYTFAYLSHPLRIEEIVYLTELLDLKAIDLVRTQEALWRDHYKNESLTEDQIIELLSAHPKLLQRPIVVIGKRAVIARPAELIESIR